VLTAADGSSFVVSGHPAERGTFELYLAAVGRPDLADDPRFADPADRFANLAELVAVLAQWAATMPTAAEAEDALAAHGLAAGQLRTARELADTEWASARRATVRIDDRADGEIELPNSPWHFSRSDTSLEGPVHWRGEDNRDVLRRLAGLRDDEVDALERTGVLSSRPPRAGS
jgi:CoA:oxalate CoA-transferase